MWRTNLKILAVVLATVGIYTLIANAIPQVESEVPQELSLGAGATPEELVKAGDDLFHGAGGCTACHGLGTRAPNLLTDQGGLGPIGARCGSRVEGMDCKAYLHQSLTDPGAYVVEGFQPIMPDMRRTLSDTQIWALIAFLESNGGEVTVTPADLESAAKAAPDSAAGDGAAPATATTDPLEIIRANQCFACHRLGDEGADVAPPFTHIGSRRSAAYIRESILDPNAKVAEGYEKFAGIMPTNFGERLTAAQLESLVSFLESRK